MTSILKDKKILITGGSARDVIDGVRHFANDTRPGDLGHRAAFLLAREGAKVQLVCPRTTLPVPDGVTVHSKALSTEDMLRACQAAALAEPPGAFVHLANIPNFAARAPSHEGRRFRESGVDGVQMDVVLNPDFITQVAAPALFGYNRFQSRVGAGDRELTGAIEKIVQKAQAMPLYGITPPRMVRQELPPVLAGKKIIVTAGATAERLSAFGDVLSQFASARQGVEIAGTLAAMGAEVVLVTGRTSLSLPQHAGITHARADTCLELLAVLQKNLPADAYIGTAAITPFTMNKPLDKLPKETETHLELSCAPHVMDLVGHLPPQLRPRTVICFTGGTKDDEVETLRARLAERQVDAICATPLDRNTRMKLGPNKTRIRWITATETADWGTMALPDAGLRLGKELVALLAFAAAKRA